jgi:hypothetical protein
MKKLKKDYLIRKSVEDFFGEKNTANKNEIDNITRWLLGKRKGISLLEADKEIADIVKQNLKDELYLKNIATE